MGIRLFIDRISQTLKQWEADAQAQKEAEAAAQLERLNAAADLFINGRGSDFHCSDGQRERFQRACSEYQIGRIISLNKKKMCCKISSSSNSSVIYNTSLENCECKDFLNSGLPCKHIYKLAMELGIINSDWDISGIPKELRERIEALPYFDQVAFIKLIPYHTSGNSFEVKKSDVPVSIIESGLVVENSDYYRVLDENYTKNDIIASLAVTKNSYTLSSKSTKKDMINWIIDNDKKLLQKLCNKHYYISFAPDVFSHLNYIYREYKYMVK